MMMMMMIKKAKAIIKKSQYPRPSQKENTKNFKELMDI
jgi:hypothetical protein